jgi:putative PIN family toxin of toxin-antitoxin system
MRVVLDTNVIISSIFWKERNCHKIVEMAINKRIMNHISQDIIQELGRILIDKFEEPQEKAGEEIAVLSGYSELVTTDEKIEISRDIKDNMIIECAVACKADYIITGDNDLLCLKEVKRIKILSPKEFLDIMNQP